MKRWGDRIAALLLLFIAGGAIYKAAQLPFPQFARVTKVAPAAYPIGVAGFLALLAFLLFLQTFRPSGPQDGEGAQEEQKAVGRNPKATQHLLVGYLVFLIYLVMIPHAGFTLATFLFTFSFIMIIGRYHAALTAGVAVGITLLLWAIFSYWIGVPFPQPWGV